MKFPSLIPLLIVLFVQTNLLAQAPIKSPAEFLGYELGSRLTEHRDAVGYFAYLSQAAPAHFRLDTIGWTYERRPLVVATLSNAYNMQRLEEIRENHLLALSNSGDSGLAIVWLSYNVHGNESVSMEAALQTAYTLVTDRKDLLEGAVIRMDPCLNPDGRDRYSSWFRRYKNRKTQVDRFSKEHQEDWPGGRTNHYLFDLNRDWAWLTQTEVVDRVREYQKWMPHIHVDFHEQGINSPYYFAPAAEPYHEVITDFQREFQARVGDNHAGYFDRNGWLYFTRERFDLLYPGYGDTYPMYNGSIGMTYEQGGGGQAGLAILTRSGDTLTLDDRILHHYTTGISTVEVAVRHKDELNREFRKYFNTPAEGYAAYVVQGHPDKLEGLGRLLRAHGIEAYAPGVSSGRGYSYQNGRVESFESDENTWVIPSRQPKSKLVKVLFEPKTEVVDSLTYDITSWSLPYAHGLNAWAMEKAPRPGRRLSERELTQWSVMNEMELPGIDGQGLIADWSTFRDAQWLSALLQAGIRMRRSSQTIRLDQQSFGRGSLVFLYRDQDLPNATEIFLEISKKWKQRLSTLPEGRIPEGPDMGSSAVQLVDVPRIAVLSGSPTDPYSFGEIWYYLEQELDYPLTVLDGSYIRNIDLSGYDVLLVPNGNYRDFLDADLLSQIADWVSRGGRVVALGNAVGHLGRHKSFRVEQREMQQPESDGRDAYGERERRRLSYQITGALYEVRMDPSHPLAYGYGERYVALREGNQAYEALSQGSVGLLNETGQPLNGFAGSATREYVRESLSAGVEKVGRGEAVYFPDNPIFRGFWANGKLLMANAIFGNF